MFNNIKCVWYINQRRFESIGNLSKINFTNKIGKFFRSTFQWFIKKSLNFQYLNHFNDPANCVFCHGWFLRLVFIILYIRFYSMWGDLNMNERLRFYVSCNLKRYAAVNVIKFKSESESCLMVTMATCKYENLHNVECMNRKK